MPNLIAGRDARLWHHQFSTAARLDKQDAVFFTKSSVMRVQLQQHLHELITLIEQTESDPMYLATGFQVLATLVLEAHVPLNDSLRQQLMAGCDCYEFIAYLRKYLKQPVDQADATPAELAQDACERQLAQVMLDRYNVETPQRQALLEQLRTYPVSA